MGSRIAGPPYRFHTKVVWWTETDKPKPGDTNAPQGVDIRFGPIDEPHEALGYILVRGWAKNALIRCM